MAHKKDKEKDKARIDSIVREMKETQVQGLPIDEQRMYELDERIVLSWDLARKKAWIIRIRAAIKGKAR
jgi:hypothetical protein